MNLNTMRNQVGILQYLPSPKYGYPKSIIENNKQFPPLYRLIYYSCEKLPDVKHVIQDPNSLYSGSHISNYIFLSALKIAIQEGIKWMLYLEHDCRYYGGDWDKIVLSEFVKNRTKDTKLAGSICVFDPTTSDSIYYSAFNHMLKQTISRNDMFVSDNYFPIRIYGHDGIPPKNTNHCTVFSNGAATLMDVDYIKGLFGRVNIYNESTKFKAWDAEIGKRIMAKEGANAFSRFLPLYSVCSCYANNPYNNKERQNLLLNRQVSIIHPVKTQWYPEVPNIIPSKKHKTFYHSGDYGDVIYSIDCIKRIGGGCLYLGPKQSHGSKFPTPHDVVTPKWVSNIKPLLLAQDYIHDVVFVDYMPNIDYNLNKFRDYIRIDGMLWQCNMRNFGYDYTDHTHPWISIDNPITINNHPIIVHRSSKSQVWNELFPWQDIVNVYGDRIIFIGSSREYEDFSQKYGQVHYVKTPNILNMAEYIAGAKLFIGNQSLGLALAESIKMPVIQEKCAFPSSNNFNRDDHHIIETGDFNIDTIQKYV